MKKLITSKRGRRCKYRGCKRLLSIYNHEVYCRIHTIYLGREDRKILDK